MTAPIQMPSFHLGSLPPLPTYSMAPFYLSLFFASCPVLYEGRSAILSDIDSQGKCMLIGGISKKSIHLADGRLSHERPLFLVEKEEGKGIYYFATRLSETDQSLSLRFDETNQEIEIPRSQWWRLLPCSSKKWAWITLGELGVKDDRGMELVVLRALPSSASDYFKTGGFDLTQIHAPIRSKL